MPLCPAGWPPNIATRLDLTRFPGGQLGAGLAASGRAVAQLASLGVKPLPDGTSWPGTIGPCPSAASRDRDELLDLFDRVFLLRIDEATQQARLAAHDALHPPGRSQAGPAGDPARPPYPRPRCSRPARSPGRDRARRAEQVFARQLDVATRHGLTLWQARATHELGTLDLMRANRTDRLARARELAAESGDLATAATIDLQLGGSAGLTLDGGACLEAALRCQPTARRFHLDLLLAEALLLEAAGHGFTGRRAAMELAIAQAERIGRPEPDLKAAAWARRGMAALMREDRDRAVTAYDTAVLILREAATVYVRPYWLYWALLHTVQDDGGDQARAEARRLTQADSPLTELILGYADAVAAGRRGCADEAEALFTQAQSAAPAPGWAAQRHLAERLAAECAVADGWGQPTGWLTEAAEFFRHAGHAHLERACRSLLRRAGAPLPRREHGHRAVPPTLAELGVTDREAEVFALVTEGLTSNEIAARLFLSVRTVDKHVERLLAKTGVSRRAELRTFRT